MSSQSDMLSQNIKIFNARWQHYWFVPNLGLLSSLTQERLTGDSVQG